LGMIGIIVWFPLPAKNATSHVDSHAAEGARFLKFLAKRRNADKA
jgi:hypothetical protein